MHRSELERMETCAACGRTVTEGVDRGYDFGTRGVLCWECAMERGGAYDESGDRWTQAPRVADLAEDD